jgi:hypothetical protein
LRSQILTPSTSELFFVLFSLLVGSVRQVGDQVGLGCQVGVWWGLHGRSMVGPSWQIDGGVALHDVYVVHVDMARRRSC